MSDDHAQERPRWRAQGDASLARADARRIPLADECVDLIVTSPPYFGQRVYEAGDQQIGCEPTPQEFLEALWAVTAECWRVLKPSGSMFVILGDKRAGSSAPGTTSGLSGRRPQGKRTGFTGSYGRNYLGRKKGKQLLPHRYAIGCMDGEADPDGIGWIVRQDQVWRKLNCIPEPVRDRTHDRHEFQGREGDSLAKAHGPDGRAGERYSQTVQIDGYQCACVDDSAPTRPAVVLDPFGGTGTTAMVARALGRFGISLDLSESYLRLARWRVFESGHSRKSIAATSRDNQGVLAL